MSISPPAQPKRKKGRHSYSSLHRGLFHAANATWGVLAYHFIVPRWLAIATVGFLAIAWTSMEIARVRSPRINAEVLRHPFFKRIIRPHEHNRISGAIWFFWGVLAALILFSKEALEVGVLAFGFGDASAQIVGSRWGRTRLLERRSLEGTGAFFAATLVVTMLFRLMLYAEATFWPTLGLAMLVAVAGAVTELFSVKLNDNVTVPLMATATAALFI